MIDLLTEEVVSFTDAARMLPRRRGGKRPHVATLYRWSQSGCRGVRLETIQVGGTRCTSRQAIARFCEQLSRDSLDTIPPPTRRQRTKSIEQAEKTLEAAGISHAP